MATEMNRAEMVITVLLLSHGRSHWFKSSIAQLNPYVVGDRNLPDNRRFHVAQL